MKPTCKTCRYFWNMYPYKMLNEGKCTCEESPNFKKIIKEDSVCDKYKPKFRGDDTNNS